MRFFVKNYREPTPSSGEYPFVVLNNDNWDDYGFKTMFHPVIHANPDWTVDLPQVKILKRGQGHGRTSIPEVFDTLGSDYCSLGQELAYYESLLTLDDEVKEDYLYGLRDTAAYPNIRKEFENEEGFSTSLLRFGSAERALDDAPSLLQGTDEADSELTFSFHTSFGTNEFATNFHYCRTTVLPGRINAIIGYNGTGKTQLLANLALVANAELGIRNRDDTIAQYGRLDPTNLRFGAVVAISYSAFDTFKLPQGSSRRTDFGYTYCGLRKFDDQGVALGLKNVDEIADEIAGAITRIDTPIRRSSLENALQPLREEPSFARADYSLDILGSNGEWRDEFAQLSTGHKINQYCCAIGERFTTAVIGFNRRARIASSPTPFSSVDEGNRRCTRLTSVVCSYCDALTGSFARNCRLLCSRIEPKRVAKLGCSDGNRDFRRKHRDFNPPCI